MYVLRRFLLSLHVSILVDHHQVIVSIHMNKILQLLKSCVTNYHGSM
jgi:hypothetical protein